MALIGHGDEPELIIRVEAMQKLLSNWAVIPRRVMPMISK